VFELIIVFIIVRFSAAHAYMIHIMQCLHKTHWFRGDN